MKCKFCSVVFLNPRPSKSIGLEYFENAYSLEHTFSENEYYNDRTFQERRNSQRLTYANLIPREGSVLLDFGAGQGNFVKTSSEHGWKSIGIEVSESAIKYARKEGVELYCSLDSIPEQSIDIITMWDVIEHLEDPKAVLIDLSKKLKAKGSIVIETANVESRDYHLFPKKWSYWHVDHYFYFSKSSLSFLMDNLGFEEVNLMTSNQDVVFNRGLALRLKKYLNWVEVVKAIRKTIFFKRYNSHPADSLIRTTFTRKN